MSRPFNAIHVDFGPVNLHASADQFFGKDAPQIREPNSAVDIVLAALDINWGKSLHARSG
jgi:hypothetical protein